MSLFVQLVLQIVLPAFLLIDLFRRDYRQRRDWIIDVLLVGGILFFVFQSARWDFFSYYLRILLLPAFGLIAYVAFRCIDRKKPVKEAPLSWKNYAEYGVKGLIILVAFVLNVKVLIGSFAPDDSINLAYPLKGSVYYVGGGGADRWINNHHVAPPQDYAIDIVRLNAFGNRASGVFSPASLEKYAIFGDRVYSPCSGRVVIAEDGHEDQVPPNRDTENLAGNHVVIACKGAEVILAHLKKESITVSVDEEVDEGQVIGQIGNSGNSSQPHLHIHAESGGPVGKILDGKGIPIRFNGRFLVRNSLFSGRNQADS